MNTCQKTQLSKQFRKSNYKLQRFAVLTSQSAENKQMMVMATRNAYLTLAARNAHKFITSCRALVYTIKDSGHT